jgi:hypothetical protein
MSDLTCPNFANPFDQNPIERTTKRPFCHRLFARSLATANPPNSEPPTMTGIEYDVEDYPRVS